PPLHPLFPYTTLFRSRQNSLNGKPVAIAGASPGAIGTAVAQQHLRAVLAHLNAPTLAQPEVFLKFDRETFPGDGRIANPGTEARSEEHTSELQSRENL